MSRVSAFLVLAALASPAAAFPTGDRFDLDPDDAAGGGGVFYTAAPAFPTANCATCHQGGPGLAAVRLGSSPEDLFTQGYLPGQVYLLEVQLQNETFALDRNGPPRCGQQKGGVFVPCNCNGFAVEPTDGVGFDTGTLCPVPPNGDGSCPSPVGDTTLLAMSGGAVFHRGYLPAGDGLPAGQENGATRWRFYWTAPAAGTGTVTFHVGVVDGNGGNGTADLPQDFDGDDTVEAHVAVAEAGMPTYDASTGCALGHPRRGAGAIGLAFALLALGRALRRRRR